MSGSSKFDISLDSPDRPMYVSGHRGSYVTASMDRSVSFRENMDNPLLSSLPNMTRSSSSVTQGDVLNFFQCVRFDPKSMVVEHKLNRPAEFKRLASASVGLPLEDSPTAATKNKQLSSPSPEDLRRLKAGVRESATKARERVKIFNDCLSVINKCFPAIPSRKRSRLDTLSSDRSNTLLPTDRSTQGMGIGKVGSQNHASTSDYEFEQQKPEERSKNAFPSKRTRTSMSDVRMDIRANGPSKPSGIIDKDKDVVRLSNGNVVLGEDRGVSIAVDGWEKSKMKKRRTGIKPDFTPSSVATKPVDGYRETKQGLQPRLPTESRPRLMESHGFRSGIVNGGLGLGKAEATSQTSSGMRSSISRTDSDNSSVLHERRERSSALEKEKLSLKAVNKANSREDLSSDSPPSGSKLNGNVRAPRSGSIGGVSKLAQAGQRSASSNEWELSNCTTKFPVVLGANNRKHTPSAQPSSPSVSNWAQGPQKIPRTGRRTNLLPLVPGNDENPVLDTSSEVITNVRRLPAHSPQPVKIKGDNFSPAALSETEESGAPDVKSKDKSKKSDEIEEKSGQNVQKMSTLLIPPKKSKAVGGDDHGDGIRRQGRTGRGFGSSKPLVPLTAERLGYVGTTKQIRSSRPGLDKAERSGRPPTRKLSDRKAYARQKHTTINATADFLVGSDDGHEELLAAANAVTNKNQCSSSTFWKKTEQFFRFISDADITYLKEQVNSGSGVETPAPEPLALDSSSLFPNSFMLNEFGKEMISGEFFPEHLTTGARTCSEISLCQRLIAAFIPEEGNQEFCFSEEDLKYGDCESQHEMEEDMAPVFFPRMSTTCDSSVYPSFNGNGVNTNGKSIHELNHAVLESNKIPVPDMAHISRYGHWQNGLNPDQVFLSGTCTEYQYCSMSMNEKLLVEIHSIGIYPDLVGGDEKLTEDISRMNREYEEQVSRKKCLLGKLLNSSSQAKELQEKGFEVSALDKLVEIAYEKYMNCWGPNVHGMKSTSGKMAKQAALAFVKRTIERCKKYEVTGKSCFDEPLYRDIFLSGISHLIDEQSLNSHTDNESGKPHLRTSGYSTDIRTSAPAVTQISPSSNQEMYYSDLFPASNPCSEQNSGKEDIWSNRVKRRELLLDEVGVSTSSGAPSSLRGSLICNAKGKRTERDREGKGNSRELPSKSGNNKIGRPGSTIIKNERKSKAKPKQKNIQLSASINGTLGKMAEQPRGMLPSTLTSSDVNESNIGKDKNNYGDGLEEPIDISGLQLPEMDPSDFGGQGEDIGSWLDIEDDGYQDHDYMGGLEIPMDDLTHLNMMI